MSAGKTTASIGVFSVIQVTCYIGSTVIVTNGINSYSAVATDGNCSIKVYDVGDWTVAAVCLGVTKSQIVTIDSLNSTKEIKISHSSITVACYSGSTVKAVSGSTTITGSAPNGYVTLDVPDTGTWTVTASYGSKSKSESVSIGDLNTQKSITLSYSTITVKAYTGSTVKAVNGSTNVTGTAVDNSVTLGIPYSGNWTVTASYSGKSKSTTVAINNLNTQTTTTLSYSTITVTCPSGSTITCSSGSTTYTATNVSSYEFAIPSTGTWTVSATKGSASASKSVSISNLNTQTSVALTYTMTAYPGSNANSTSNWNRSDWSDSSDFQGGTFTVSSSKIYIGLDNGGSMRVKNQTRLDLSGYTVMHAQIAHTYLNGTYMNTRFGISSDSTANKENWSAITFVDFSSGNDSKEYTCDISSVSGGYISIQSFSYGSGIEYYKIWFT